MQLQPTETILLTTDEDAFTLTNLRVVGHLKDWGYYQKIFIYLEDISSIQVVYRSFAVLLALAGFATVYGLWSAVTEHGLQQPSGAVLGFGAALVLLLIWWGTRRRVIAIHPNGGRPLEISVSKMESRRADELLERIQLAKTERVRVLYKV